VLPGPGLHAGTFGPIEGSTATAWWQFDPSFAQFGYSIFKRPNTMKLVGFLLYRLMRS